MKVFSTDFEHGSLIDRVSKTAGTNTNGEFKKSEKGLSWHNDGTAAYITLPSDITLSRLSATIELWFKISDAETNPILGNSSETGFKFVRIHGSNLVLESNTNGDNWSSVIGGVPVNIWQHYALHILLWNIRK